MSFVFSFSPLNQMRSWIWTTASGRTSTSPLELSRCSSGSFLSRSSLTGPSMTSSMPSVSNMILCVTVDILSSQLKLNCCSTRVGHKMALCTCVFTDLLCVCFRILWPEAAGEFTQRLNQEVAKTEPRHNANPLRTPAEVRKAQNQLTFHNLHL